jgi:hypothetical protein
VARIPFRPTRADDQAPTTPDEARPAATQPPGVRPGAGRLAGSRVLHPARRRAGQRRHRTERILAASTVRDAIVSVAGLATRSAGWWTWWPGGPTARPTPR